MASATPPSLDQGNLQLGIRWGDGGRCADVDLDLYIRSTPDRPYLFFANKESDDGRYHKDHQSAPEVRNGLEYVSITDQAQLADLDILVNHYAGHCPGGPIGKVRAYVDGVVYEMPFRIAAEQGNGGRLIDRPNNPHWVRIDPRTLFNLR